jgi:hypothetical protein
MRVHSAMIQAQPPTCRIIKFIQNESLRLSKPKWLLVVAAPPRGGHNRVTMPA